MSARCAIEAVRVIATGRPFFQPIGVRRPEHRGRGSTRGRRPARGSGSPRRGGLEVVVADHRPEERELQLADQIRRWRPRVVEERRTAPGAASETSGALVRMPVPAPRVVADAVHARRAAGRRPVVRHALRIVRVEGCARPAGGQLSRARRSASCGFVLPGQQPEHRAERVREVRQSPTRVNEPLCTLARR